MTYEEKLIKYRKAKQKETPQTNAFLTDVNQLKQLITQHIKCSPNETKLLVPLSDLKGINQRNFKEVHDWLVYQIQCKCQLDSDQQALCIDLVTDQKHGDDPLIFLIAPLISSILFWIFPLVLSPWSKFITMQHVEYSVCTVITFMMQLVLFLIVSAFSYLMVDNYYAAKFEFQHIIDKRHKLTFLPKTLLITQLVANFVTVNVGWGIVVASKYSTISARYFGILFAIVMIISTAFFIASVIHLINKDFELA